MSVNLIILLGRVGRDPEFKNNVCKFSLATGEKYTAKDGKEVDTTQWHNITCFGKQAEQAYKYLLKGFRCHVEGKIQYGKYAGKDGIERHTTEVIAQSLEFLDRKQLDVAMEKVQDHIVEKSWSAKAMRENTYGGTDFDQPPAKKEESFTFQDIPF